MRIPAILLLSILPVFAALAESPAAAPASPAAPAKEAFKAVVVADDAVILSGSSKAYYPVGHMQAGSILDVVDASYPGYCEVVPPGCCASFVPKASVKADEKEERGTITEDGVGCYAAGLELAPEKSFRIQRKMGKGEAVEILAAVGAFYRIETPARITVFVPADQIRRATEADLKDGPPEAKPGYKAAIKPSVKPEATLEAKPETKPQPKEESVKPAVKTPEEKRAVKTQDPVAPEATEDIDTPATDPALRAVEGRLNAARAAAKGGAVPSAKLRELVAQYTAQAKRTDLNAVDGQLANGRMAQVSRDLKISENLEKVSAAEKAAKDAAKPGQAVPQIGYDAVGQLKLSDVYNGNALPKLYRLVDATTDATIAYVLPAAVSGELINKLVGIQGDIEVDPVLKLRVIKVKKADALSANGKPAGK